MLLLKSLQSKYRPDIDGLRAIAVISVIVFHFFPNLIRGGFIGVDIFFVISGYLISNIIFCELEQKKFRFVDFYSKRIKRIFPALLLVLTFSIILGYFILLPNEYKQLGKHIFGGATFTSNFILWNESGYFDNAAETKLLLHLWSLAVEEQFYILWPLVVCIAYHARFNFLIIILLIAAFSFGLNVRYISTDVVADFYSPITRFWELRRFS
jgi:peptidoglycan/LPS O-acetylase OafA/YrhL